jgi:hypothetical protein
VLLLHWMIFRDSIAVMRLDRGMVGTLALEWIGTSILIAACLFYISVHTSETVSFIFWFLAGVIATRSTRLSLAQQNPQRQALAA